MWNRIENTSKPDLVVVIVQSDSLQSQGLQHARLPCPSLFPRVCSNMSNQWFYPSHPLLPPSPAALNLSQHQGLFQGVSIRQTYPYHMWGYWLPGLTEWTVSPVLIVLLPSNWARLVQRWGTFECYLSTNRFNTHFRTPRFAGQHRALKPTCLSADSDCDAQQQAILEKFTGATDKPCATDGETEAT